MFNIELKEVHIGQAIDKRREELKMSKSEFGRQIGVPQQHINRIFERETIETKKLIKISKVLEFNFFALFCKLPTNVNALLAAVALGDGDAWNNIGDAALASQLALSKKENEGQKALIEQLNSRIALLEQQVERLDAHLRDKDQMIELLKESKMK